jgi:hypothetical protein
MSPTIFRLFQLVTFTILLFSCSIQKRIHRPGYHFEWRTINLQFKKDNQTNKVKSNLKNHELALNESNAQIAEKQNSIEEDNSIRYSDTLNMIASVNDQAPILQTKHLIKLKKTEECDEIITHDGDVILANVLEVGTEEIKYKKCDLPDGPIYSIYNNDVFVIIYKNGTRDVITNSKDIKKETADPIPTKRKVGMSVTGFIMGLVGYFVGYYLSMLGGLVICLLGIIFSSIAIHKIRKDPNKYGKKALAVLGLVFSLIGFLLIGLVLILAFL